MLRLGGFVTAARGTGGYSLARPASQIALGDVMAVLGGRLFEGDFCETFRPNARTASTRFIVPFGCSGRTVRRQLTTSWKDHPSRLVTE